jgi:hypothetical protein
VKSRWPEFCSGLEHTSGHRNLSRCIVTYSGHASLLMEGSLSPRLTVQSILMPSPVSDPDSDDELIILFGAAAAIFRWRNMRRTSIPRRDISLPGARARNRNRFRGEGAIRLDRDYINRVTVSRNVPSIFSEAEFERRFRERLRLVLNRQVSKYQISHIAQ